MNILYSTHFDPLGADGISQHFACLAHGLAQRVRIDRSVLLTKRSMEEANRAELIRSGQLGKAEVLVDQPTMTLAVLRLLRQRWLHPRALAGTAPATVFLFGYHWLLLIPFLGRKDRLILAGFDCWSGRERRLAEIEKQPFRRTLRWAFSRFLLALERRAAPRLSGLALVSQAEIDKFCAGLAPDAAQRLAAHSAILPPRSFALPERRHLLEMRRPRVLVWADCRVRPLLLGAAELMTVIGNNPDLVDGASYALLSRASDEAIRTEMSDTSFFTNHTFVDDIEAFIADFDIIVVPDTFGSGVKNRTVQSLASGALVVATRIAAEGLGEPLVEALAPVETMEDIAHRLHAALEDRPTARAAAVLMQQRTGELMARTTAEAGWEGPLLL